MARPGCVLITGGAGFIGSHLADRMLEDGWRVTVVDNFDPYYDPATKWSNVGQNRRNPNYSIEVVDIRSPVELAERLQGVFDLVIHLAAKAGVRPSIADPLGYSAVNVSGTQHVLEFCRNRGIPRVIFASSSSVYGVNPHLPWKEDDHVLQPISPYAATKVCGELLGHVYSRLWGFQFLALRFFTVYGPRQRPDLAIHRFARLMLDGRPVPIFGDGSSRRDYTHVDDVVDGIAAAVDYSASQYEVINLGNNRTVSLTELVSLLEEAIGTRAQLAGHPAQEGDVPATWADISKAERLLGYRPRVPIEVGLSDFVSWLRGQPGGHAGSGASI